jgi:Domain of unknown function (DUF929)
VKLCKLLTGFAIGSLGLPSIFSAGLAVAGAVSGTSTVTSTIVDAIGQPVRPGLLERLRTASDNGMAAYPPDESTSLMKGITGPYPGRVGRVTVLYVGAENCPFCAAQRWGIVLTLLRFGTFHGLRYMASSASDVYPNTPTFTFVGATYSSKYIDFQAVEVEDRNRNRLQTMNALQRKIYSEFDKPPYMQVLYGVPFVYLNGRYVITRPLVPVKDLGDLTWNKIAETLGSGSSTLRRQVLRNVNALTAALCHLDGGQPASVCSSRGVKVVEFRPPNPVTVQASIVRR